MWDGRVREENVVHEVVGTVKTIGLDKDRTCDHLLSRLDALPTELPVHALSTPGTGTQ